MTTCFSERDIRVVLIDDHELIRRGLVGAFDRVGGFEVVGEGGSVAEGLEVATAVTPDVVVTDVRLPDGSGLDIVRTLRAARPELGLVVLTMYAGDEQIFAAMDAGASAIVGKDAASHEVVCAARQAAISPRSFASPDLAQAMLRRMTSSQPRLSDRERQVLQLLAEGLGVAAIGATLYVSESTAKAHVARIYEKLGVANRAQALMAAMRMGLLVADAVPSSAL